MEEAWTSTITPIITITATAISDSIGVSGTLSSGLATTRKDSPENIFLLGKLRRNAQIDDIPLNRRYYINYHDKHQKCSRDYACLNRLYPRAKVAAYDTKHRDA